MNGMRDSMYLGEYLAGNIDRDRPITPGTFLQGRLQGRAKRYGSSYYVALVNSLKRAENNGTAVRVRSARGSVAWIPAPPPTNHKLGASARRSRDAAGLASPEGEQ